jgi:SAM-dependent methyltransferase
VPRVRDEDDPHAPEERVAAQRSYESARSLPPGAFRFFGRGATPLSVTEPNAAQIEYWNAAQHWVDDQAGHDEMLEPLGRLAQAALAPQAGERIVDIGCGTGATTLALADAVGASGAVVGVDVSGTLLAVARERAVGHANVSFVEADAQTKAFDEPFDGAFSRFGVMFFADPVEAFRNIARSLRSRGRLGFVCWREPSSNQWWTVAAEAAARYVELPSPADPTAPGPFALADPERLERVLDEAGFGGISLDDVRRPVLLGGRGGVETALGFLRRSRLGAAIVEGTTDGSGAQEVFDAVARALQPYVTPEGVEMTAAVWVVKARRG